MAPSPISSTPVHIIRNSHGARSLSRRHDAGMIYTVNIEDIPLGIPCLYLVLLLTMREYEHCWLLALRGGNTFVALFLSKRKVCRAHAVSAELSRASSHVAKLSRLVTHETQSLRRSPLGRLGQRGRFARAGARQARSNGQA